MTLTERIHTLCERGLDGPYIGAILNVSDTAVQEALLGELEPSHIDKHFAEPTGGYIVALDDDYLYASTHSGKGIDRISRVDGTVEKDWIDATVGEVLAEVEGILVTDTHIYWLGIKGAQGGWLGRANIDGSEAEPDWVQLWEAGEFPAGWAAGLLLIDGHLWFDRSPSEQSEEPHAIGRVKLDGTDLETAWLPIEHLEGTSFASDDTYVYFRGPTNYISRLKRDGTGLEAEWVKLPGEVSAAVVGDGHLYMKIEEDIARMSLAGTGLLTWFAGEGGRLAFDKGWLYFSREERIGRAWTRA